MIRNMREQYGARDRSRFREAIEIFEKLKFKRLVNMAELTQSMSMLMGLKYDATIPYENRGCLLRKTAMNRIERKHNRVGSFRFVKYYSNLIDKLKDNVILPVPVETKVYEQNEIQFILRGIKARDVIKLGEFSADRAFLNQM